MIGNMDYAQTTSKKGLKGSGLDVGETVLVIATKAIPTRKDDPYVRRMYVVCVRVDKDGFHHMPKEDTDDKAFLVDPRCLTKIEDEGIIEALKDALREQYKTDPEG